MADPVQKSHKKSSVRTLPAPRLSQKLFQCAPSMYKSLSHAAVVRPTPPELRDIGVFRYSGLGFWSPNISKMSKNNKNHLYFFSFATQKPIYSGRMMLIVSQIAQNSFPTDFEIFSSIRQLLL